MAEKLSALQTAEFLLTAKSERMRVIAHWLVGKLLRTKGGVRLLVGGLGTVGNLLG